MAGSNRFKRIKNQVNILFDSPYIKKLSKVERYEFLQLCHRRTFQRGEFIYYQDDPGAGMYFIESGAIQLITGVNTGRESVVQTQSAGESFGLMSLGYESQRLTSARCSRDAVLLGFFKSDFETLKKRHPKIAAHFMESLASITMRRLDLLFDNLSEDLDQKRITELKMKTFYLSDV